MNNDNTIGIRINTLLAERKIEQKKLADAIGVQPPIISYYCSGKRKPNLDQIIKIAQYFSVSTDYLLGISDVPSADLDVRAICEYTGLSLKSINSLRIMPNEESYKEEIEVVNEMISSKAFWWLVQNVCELKDAMKSVARFTKEPTFADFIEIGKNVKVSYLGVTEALPEMIDELYQYHSFLKNLPTGLIPLVDMKTGKLTKAGEKLFALMEEDN